MGALVLGFFGARYLDSHWLKYQSILQEQRIKNGSTFFQDMSFPVKPTSSSAKNTEILSISEKLNIVIPLNRKFDEETNAMMERIAALGKGSGSVVHVPTLPNINLVCCIAMLFETRVETRTPDILSNIDENIPSNWDMVVITPNDRSPLFEGLPKVADIRRKRRLLVVPLDPSQNKAEWSIHVYNGFVLSPEFWAPFLSYERVLTFQTDSVMCGARQGNNISSFLKYDYVGGPWFGDGLGHLGQSVTVGNGGFSLRNPKWMVHCAQLLSINPSWGTAEDIFFSWCVSVFGGNVAPKTDAGHFCMETVGWPDALAMHQSSRYYALALRLNTQQTDSMITYKWGTTASEVESNMLKSCPPLALILDNAKKHMQH